MAILSILEFPDERLRKKALPVAEVDESIRQLVDDLFETMYAAPGVGLAATQVNIQKRVLVLDTSDQKNEPYCFINPEILQRTGRGEGEEGCLSVPGIFEKVSRSEKIVVKALNREGECFEMEAEGLLAVCIQHEIDHLEGKLFVDYLSPLKRQLLRGRLKKEQRNRSTGQGTARKKTSASL
jgi:peptide deformylase